MYCRTVSSKGPSFANPSFSALETSNLGAQLSTILSVAWSLLFSTNANVFSPATVRRASNISCTLTVIPGKLTILDSPNFSFEIFDAKMRFLTTVLGEQTHISVSRDTGRIDLSPFNGSRKIPEAKDEAAPVGLPGLTVT